MAMVQFMKNLPLCDAEEDDEGISERSLRRTPSDEEVETTEAVALFDYVGQTDNELSFKRNQLLYIYKRMSHEWWEGSVAGGKGSRYITNGSIKLKGRCRDSAPNPIHQPSLFTSTADPSSSLNSLSITVYSNDHLDVPSTAAFHIDLSIPF